MSASWEVTGINKLNRYNAWEKIDHVGGITPEGRSFKMTQEQAIKFLETGGSLHVEVGGRFVYCLVGRSSLGNKYIKTVADGEDPNNLLELPECY